MPTTTKTKTTTKIGLAVVFLAIATVLAIGTQRFSNRQALNRAAQMVQQVTPTFCLAETAAAPRKSSITLSPELFGIPAAQAARGALVVEAIRYDSGRHMDADLFIYRGTELVREVSAPGGEGRTSLEEGTYRVHAISWVDNLVGERTVAVIGNYESRYGIEIQPGPPPTPPTVTATVPTQEPLTAQYPGEQDCGTGLVRVIAGNICDRDNRILTNASGIINVSQRGQAVCHTNAVSGAFKIYDLSNDTPSGGTYTIQFQNPGLGVFEKEVTLEPKRVNFRTR